MYTFNNGILAWDSSQLRTVVIPDQVDANPNKYMGRSFPVRICSLCETRGKLIDIDNHDLVVKVN